MTKKKRIVACCIFHTPENEILMQDREGIARYGEEWSFFGGGVEEGETKEEGLLREIKEELDYDIKGHSFLGMLEERRDDLEVEIHFYEKEIENLDEFTLLEGTGMKLFPIEEALQQKLLPSDRKMLKRFREAHR